MNRIFETLFSKKSIVILLSITILAWLYSLFHRYIEADEAILAEYSYYFLKNGYARLKTIPEILDWDTRVFSHHRFFTWYGAVLIKFFGWSITVFKISILPFFALFFLLIYKYFQLEKLDKKHFLLACLIIITCPILLLKSFSFRPDVLLMTEGMAILYFLRRYQLERKWQFALIAGLISGLAFLTHLNGAAFCITGFIFLIVRKEFKGLIPYVAAGAVVGGLYFIELLPPGNFDKFIYELTNWPTVNHGENYIGGGILGVLKGRIVKLLSEHQRFFWGDKVMAFSSLFFLSIILTFKTLRKKASEPLIFVLILILSLNLFGSHVAERYLLFYYGPMVIITTTAIMLILEQMKWVKAIPIVLVFLFQFVLAAKMLHSIQERSYNTVENHSRILHKIPNNQYPSVLVPVELIFNEFPNYNLYTFKTYEYLQEDMENDFTQNQLLEKASSLGMDYIILNKKLTEDKAGWFYGGVNKKNDYYKITFKDNQYTLLNKIKN